MTCSQRTPVLPADQCCGLDPEMLSAQIQQKTWSWFRCLEHEMPGRVRNSAAYGRRTVPEISLLHCSTAELHGVSLVLTCLDYCNAVLAGRPAKMRYVESVWCSISNQVTPAARESTPVRSRQRSTNFVVRLFTRHD